MELPNRFTDRTEAGALLAAALEERDITVDIVLAIPRGGLPLGRAVADALGAPLDVVVAKKIGAPNNPEYALGAVTSSGSVWRNEAGISGFGSDEEYFERALKRETENALAKAERYHTDREPLELTGKRVVVVDDGVATGSTIRACIQHVTDAAADTVVVAIPVGPPDTVHELQSMADEVVCLLTPSSFMAVGQFYDHFDQVSDEEAIAYLEE